MFTAFCSSPTRFNGRSDHHQLNLQGQQTANQSVKMRVRKKVFDILGNIEWFICAFREIGWFPAILVKHPHDGR